MATDGAGGYVAASGVQDIHDDALPIFNVERVQLQFSISSDFAAAQVANNVLILALATGRILRIDLDNPADIDDIDLPKRSSETGVIRKLFLDPTASHLIITTALGENYYLHTQSRQPKALSRLKGVAIESIAWNPSLPTASTREILVGAADGNVYEVYIEPSAEFYRREEKYLKTVYKLPDGPVTGLWVDLIPGKADFRRILVSSQSRLLHFVGRIGRHGHEGGGSIFSKLFETEPPTFADVDSPAGSAPSALVVSPEPPDGPSYDILEIDRVFGWLSSQGVYYGSLITSPSTPDLGDKLFSRCKTFSRSRIPSSSVGDRRKSAEPTGEAIASVALTQWHVLSLVEGRVVAVNRLNDGIVYDQVVLEPGQRALGLLADEKKNTFWLVTTQEIFEIVVTDEDREVWKIMLEHNNFDAALRYARTPSQKDAVATASGDHLLSRGHYLEAAGVYGKSSKPFEQVSLALIDHDEQDALRKYLVTKLANMKRSATMQRIMVASWLLEVYMAKLNSLDDAITTKAELAENMNAIESTDQLSAVRSEFQSFVTKHKTDLDRKTAYDIISSHGREEELLFYATAVNDYNYVLAYWVQRERWPESLDVLKKQTEPKIFYSYSSVLMSHAPVQLVDILTRQSNLEPRNLIPALLNYNKDARVPLSQNQAARYLLFAINQLRSTDAAVHNTLISIYAAHPSGDETALLSYLTSQSHQAEPSYDADFALRLCIRHKRVQSCVHIYSSMEQYLQAVELALAHGEIELASSIADRPEENPALRKKLWLTVAKKVISQSDGIKTAIDFLSATPLLKIEDLIPFFPDFLTIDSFKTEICAALEAYAQHIDALKREMDESARTAANIRADIARLDARYAIIEPGERCFVCELPLLSRQFFVFPCQHAFHGDCLTRRVVELLGREGGTGKARARRIGELQLEIGGGKGGGGARRERAIKELDGLVAASCILCSDMAVKLVDEPFVTTSDDRAEWAL